MFEPVFLSGFGNKEEVGACLFAIHKLIIADG